MNSPISRREFFASLVPSWATRKNLVAGVICVGVLLVVVVAVSILRAVGFLNTLKTLAIGFGLVFVLSVLYGIASLLQNAFKKAPPVIQALVAVLFQFAGGVAVCVFGAYAYSRWQATEDRVGLAMTTVGMLVFAFFSEWGKRRENHRSELKSGAAPTSKSKMPAGVDRP